jgi:hypothetical protein
MSRRRPNRAPQNAHGPASASSDDDVPIAQLHPPRRVRPGQRLTDQSIGQAVEALEDMRERQHAKRRRYSTQRSDDESDDDSPAPIFDSFVDTFVSTLSATTCSSTTSI